MLETRAIVMQIEGEFALVQSNQGNGCSQCAGKGCGSGKVAQMFCSTPRYFRVKNPVGARIGDEVVIEVADGTLLRSILLVYALPLALTAVGMMIGYSSTTLPEQKDAFAAIGALIGVVLGFACAKTLSSRVTQQLPQIGRRC